MTGAVITGTGMVSPLGTGVDPFLKGLHSNEVTVQVAPWADEARGLFFWYSVVSEFDPTLWMDPRVIAGTDLFAQWTIAAAEQAVRQSGIERLDPRRTAIVHGTSMGGTRAILKAQHQLERHGPQGIDRKTLIMIWPNMAASQLAMRWGLHGPQLTVCTACASSVDAIGTALRMLRTGAADVAIVGGTDGAHALADGTQDGDFVPAVLAGQISYGMMTAERDRLKASRPFDVNRAGIVTGEGCAMLVLETEEHAAARGATVLGRIGGYGSLADAFHPSSPEPDGTWEAAAMREAQQDAGVAPSDVDAIVAHGTATPKGDTAEIRAINSLFGDRTENPIPVMSIKGHVGHTGAASGAMGAILALDTFEHGRFPNTANTTDVDPECRFHVVTGEPIDLRADTVQVNAFGFGGQDASMIVQRAG